MIRTEAGLKVINGCKHLATAVATFQEKSIENDKQHFLAMEKELQNAISAFKLQMGMGMIGK